MSKRKLLIDTILATFSLAGVGLFLYSMLNVEGWVNLVSTFAVVFILTFLKHHIDSEYHEDKAYDKFR